MQQWTVLAAAVIGSFGRSALAEASRASDVTVMWRAPEGCPSEASVRASIEALLRDATDDRRAAPVRFDGTVTPIDGRLRLDVQTRSSSASESKTVLGESCDNLADAFALIVAFTVDPRLSGASEQPQRPTPRAPPEPREPYPRAPPEPREPASRSPALPARDTPHRWAVAGVVAASAGNLPFPGLGVGASIAYGDRPRWELAAMFWPSQQRTLLTAQGALGVSVDLLVGRPSLCVPASSALEVCAVVELGRMQGTGRGALVASSGASWWVSVGAAVATHTHIAGPLHLRVRLDVGVPLFRPAFVSERPAGAREIWQPSAMYAALSLVPEAVLSSTDGASPGHNR